MGDVRIRPPQPGDAARISRRLRPMDRLECAAFGLAPMEAVVRSMDLAFVCRTIEIAGKAEGVWGIGAISLAAGIGRPWLLGTPRMGAERRLLLTLAKDQLQDVELMFPRLENLVHARNEVSQRWLKRLGFEIDPVPVYSRGHALLRFSKGT